MADFFNLVDRLYYKVKATAGFCPAYQERLADYLAKAEQYTNARQASSMVSHHPDLPEKLKNAGDASANVHGYVSKAKTINQDVSAACEIGDAIKVLNVWANDPKADNRLTAAAFDKLFGGVTRYAEKLPFPANSYAPVLAQIKIAQFFTNMQAFGESRVGGNELTPTGRQMKAVMEELDRQGRGF